MNSPRVCTFALSALLAASQVPAAVPALTSLPSGWSWQSLGSGGYDSGTQATERGGTNGQVTPPYNDTSFGVMNEAGSAWFTGNDQSNQQFVQRQVFGNFGTSAPPGPSGTRFFNSGTSGTSTVNSTTGATSAGDNFSSNALEKRSVSLTNWSNSNPDAGGVATAGQVVFVPTVATLITTRGFGSDEMYMGVAGGLGGGTSQFRVDINIYSMMNAPSYTIAEGGVGMRDFINDNATITINNAGGGTYGFDGSQRIAWGYDADFSDPSLDQSNALSFTRDSANGVFEDGSFVADPTEGIPNNSTGYSITQNFDILSLLAQDGSSFAVEFESQAEMFVGRISGDADARFSMGPGMEGQAQLVVQYELWQAVPEPASGVLTLLGAMVLLRRRR